MLTDDDRKHILDRLLSTIYDISDIEYQKRVWIRGEGPEVDDFEETINYFFDDTEFVCKDYKAYGVSENQYQLLIKFRDAFDTFRDDYHYPLDFIDTYEWKKIMSMAREVTEAFHYNKDPDEFNKSRAKYLLMKQIVELIFKLASLPRENNWIFAEDSKDNDFKQMASFFLENGKLILDNYQDYGLFDYHYQALKKFYDAFRTFLKEHSFEIDFTNNLAWEKVKEIGKETLAVFHYQSKSNLDNHYN